MLQLRINQLCGFYILFSGVVFLFCFAKYNRGSNSYLPDLLIAFVGEVVLLFANHFIRKDEALVRSLDRLR